MPTTTATHLGRRSRRGGGCAAPGARAPPLPRTARVTQRVTERARSGASSSPWGNAGAVGTLCRSRPTRSCPPAETLERLTRPPAARPQRQNRLACRGCPFGSPWACGRGIAAGASGRRPLGALAQPRRGKVTRGTPASASGRPRGQHRAPAGHRRGTQPHPARRGPDPRRGPGATCRPRCLR